MFDEVKAEITELASNTVFVRNLSLTFVLAIAISCGLSQLQSQDLSLSDRQSLTSISNSSSLKIIVRRK